MLVRLMVADGGGPTARRAPCPSYDQLASTLNAIPDLMFELDAEGRHWDFRALRPELLVAPPEALLGYTVSDVMPAEAAKAVMAALQETMRQGYSHGTHIHLPTPTGERWFEVSMARKEKVPGEEPRFIALSRDITERKTRELQTEQLAFLDPLTGLPNRHLLKERLADAQQVSEQSGQHGALFFLDLDNFKELNDTRGHQTGDLLLTLVARRLGATMRKDDTVARWGGDEFIVVAPGLDPVYETAAAQAGDICDQMLSRLRVPYELDGARYTCIPSVGIHVFKGTTHGIEDVIRHADMAMYACKRRPDSDYIIADPLA